MKEDPVVHNSWRMVCSSPYGKNLMITYFKVKSTVLRYNYVVAEKWYMDLLVGWCGEQGKFEHEKLRGMEGSSREEKLRVWTW